MAQIDKRLFDEAIRLGEYQADRVIDLANEIRRLRRVLWQQTAKIEKLQAALREIANLRYDNTSAAEIAQHVLAQPGDTP